MPNGHCPDHVARCLDRATSLFKREFGPRPPGRLWPLFVPGRIEVLGKHTDYAGGRSLLAATAQGVAVAAAPNRTGQIRIANADPRFPKAVFPLKPGLETPQQSWLNYPMTVARRLLRNFQGGQPLRGVDMALASDLPPAGGLSSSTAIIVGSFLAIAGPNRLEEHPRYRANLKTPEDLATYLACVENGSRFRRLDGDRGVGTCGGSEDHVALLCCQAGRLSVYSFCPTRFEQVVPFPHDLVFLVCHSGVVAEKTGDALEKYNAVSARARRACAAYNSRYRTNHETLRDVVRENALLSPEDLLDRFGRIPGVFKAPHRLFDRFRQFYLESEQWIPRAVHALGQGDLEQFGRMVDLSHHHAGRFLRNIVPETEWLQSSARDLGAQAASAFGAGFGGSVYAVVPASRAGRFQRAWQAAYLKKFPKHRQAALWLVTRPAQGACWIDRKGGTRGVGAG